jgi:hypothetical protein
VEFPGKLCKVKALSKRLTEKVSLRKIDSVFPDNSAKNVIAQSVLAPKPKESGKRLV